MANMNGVLKKLLYQAQHGSDVDEILTEANLLEEDLWKPIGADHANETIIRGQSSSAEGALGERIINSIDSVLMRKCYEHGIDPRSNNAPSSMKDAAERLLHLPDGKLGKFQGNYSDIVDIFCTATGNESHKLTLNLADRGEGQTPDNMKHTFLSLPIGKDSPYKKGIPFVQGRYNQGSSGSYKFSPYTLIVTKRPESLLTVKSRLIIDQHIKGSTLDEIYNRKNEWGWTIVRKFERQRDTDMSWYGYLAPDDIVPSYNHTKMKLLPKSSIPKVSDKLSDKEKRSKLNELKKAASDLAYNEEMDGGSFIKLFDFPFTKIKNSDIWSVGIRELRSKIFYETVLPIKMTELRSWGNRIKGRGDYSYLTGLLSSIIREDAKDKFIEKNYPKDETLYIDKIGNIRITKWVLKKTSDNWLAGTSVVYVLNGQVHSKEKSSYLKQLKLYNLEESLLVAVNINDIPVKIRDKIFRVDRTFMEETEEANLLKIEIESNIRNDSELKKINDARLEELASNTEINREASHKIMNKLLKEIPGLVEIFKGTEFPMSVGTGKTLEKVRSKYVNAKFGKKSPTFFQPSKKFQVKTP